MASVAWVVLTPLVLIGFPVALLSWILGQVVGERERAWQLARTGERENHELCLVDSYDRTFEFPSDPGRESNIEFFSTSIALPPPVVAYRSVQVLGHTE